MEYQTSSTVQIKLANLSLVSSIVTDLAEDGVSTDVEWSLTEVTKRQVEKQARKAAVVEAGNIAQDYADALGQRIVKAVKLSDIATPRKSPSSRFSDELGYFSGSAEVTVAEITVSSTVVGDYKSA